LGLLATMLGLATSVAAAGPDDPGARVPPAGYAPVTAGSKSYRPVEPLPWGDINRRVAPPPRPPAQAVPPDSKTSPQDKQ
jgi:hypothetical protein